MAGNRKSHINIDVAGGGAASSSCVPSGNPEMPSLASGICFFLSVVMGIAAIAAGVFFLILQNQEGLEQARLASGIEHCNEVGPITMAEVSRQLTCNQLQLEKLSIDASRSKHTIIGAVLFSYGVVLLFICLYRNRARLGPCCK